MRVRSDRSHADLQEMYECSRQGRVIKLFFFKKLWEKLELDFGLFMRDTEREREAETQAEGEAGLQDHALEVVLNC